MFYTKFPDKGDNSVDNPNKCQTKFPDKGDNSVDNPNKCQCKHQAV